MVFESQDQKKTRVKKIIRKLEQRIPNAQIALNFTNPLELLVATILSAQCTDKRVNEVTRKLFNKYKTVDDYADANLKEFEKDIQATGFYKAKARSVTNCARQIRDQFGRKVPQNMEDLVTLSGVGRKTANVVLGNAFGIPGIAVDTHVKRVSGRLDLTEKKDPEKIEFDLNQIVPKKNWTHFTHLLILHGRLVCHARKPKCSECPIHDLCPSRQDVPHPRPLKT